MRFIGVLVPVELAKELRVRAAEQDISLSELVRRAAARMLAEDRAQLRKFRRKHSVTRITAENNRGKP